MNLDFVKSMANKGLFKVRKHSPEILLATGIISGIGGAISAYKAKPKIDSIVEAAARKKEEIVEAVEEYGYTEDYTEEDKKKDFAIIFTNTGLNIAREFAPAIGLGVLSVSCILASHNIMRRRNAALAAAYEILDYGFKSYRSRVIDRLGEEMDRELRFGAKEIEVEETVIGKDGKERKKTKKEKVIEDPYADVSSYARFFDAANPNWEKDSVYNLAFLKTQQAWANDLLRAKGYLFLNDVYKLLGFDDSRAGQMVGWVYDPDGTKHGKHWPTDKPWDNYIDFGIYEAKRMANRDFVNGYEDVILLDFNVDGNILELIPC